MTEEHRANLPHIKLSSFIGLLQKSSDATARVAFLSLPPSPSHGIVGRAGEISKLTVGRDLYYTGTKSCTAKMLYGDLWFPYGPLAPYLEAALVGIFGASLTLLLSLWNLRNDGHALSCYFQSAQGLTNGRPDWWRRWLASVQGFEPSLFSYIFPYTIQHRSDCCSVYSLPWFTIRAYPPARPSQSHGGRASPEEWSFYASRRLVLRATRMLAIRCSLTKQLIGRSWFVSLCVDALKSLRESLLWLHYLWMVLLETHSRLYPVR